MTKSNTPSTTRSIFLMLALALLALMSACASGSAIVTGTTRAPTDWQKVRVYLEPPGDFEVIGLVNASSKAGLSEQGSADYAIEELKKQSAKLGANGVLLTQTTSVAGAPLYKGVGGRAIFVKSQ